MPNTTGGLRGQRNQSGSNGSKTWTSMLVSSSGCASIRRLYGGKHNPSQSTEQFYMDMFNLSYGQFRK